MHVHLNLHHVQLPWTCTRNNRRNTLNKCRTRLRHGRPWLPLRSEARTQGEPLRGTTKTTTTGCFRRLLGTISVSLTDLFLASAAFFFRGHLLPFLDVVWCLVGVLCLVTSLVLLLGEIKSDMIVVWCFTWNTPKCKMFFSGQFRVVFFFLKILELLFGCCGACFYLLSSSSDPP